MESFDKIIGIFISVIIMFLFPLLYFAQKQDMIAQIYAINETVDFVDNIKNKGYLNTNMYQSYIDRLSRTNNLYNIKMRHSHKVVIPEYDEDSGEFMDSFYTVYEDTYEYEILEVLDREGVYYLSQGDDISIGVQNKSLTLATKIMNIIYRREIPKEQIMVQYGGRIRDEIR